jgi:hypothetical protein
VVPVMQVGVVRVAMHHPLVPMSMRVRLGAVPARLVRMAVVLVVHVTMLVLHLLVHVFMLVALAHVQPYTGRHERERRPE